MLSLCKFPVLFVSQISGGTVEHGRIKVLQLIKSLDRGGAERLLTHMIVKGAADSFEYDVAFVRSDMAGLVDELEAGGTKVYDLGATGDYQLAWTARLRRLLLVNRYDVVHNHSPYAAGLSRLVTRTMREKDRPRLVCTEHSLWSHDRAPSRILGRTTSRWDDVRIAVAETNRDDLPPALRRRTRVIRHGIDLDEVVTLAAASGRVRADLGLPADELLVVSVANLRPQKGYPTLLKAAKKVIDSGLPVTFLAAGSGPLEEELLAEHARLGLGQRFQFLGQRSDAQALIAAADVTVLASDWECMPVAVMEAFALGTPVVASAVGELQLVIESEVNGVLVPPGRPDELAAALTRVLLDPSLAASLAGNAARTAAEFDVHRAREKVESVYAELLAR